MNSCRPPYFDVFVALHATPLRSLDHARCMVLENQVRVLSCSRLTRGLDCIRSHLRSFLSRSLRTGIDVTLPLLRVADLRSIELPHIPCLPKIMRARRLCRRRSWLMVTVATDRRRQLPCRTRALVQRLQRAQRARRRLTLGRWLACDRVELW